MTLYQRFLIPALRRVDAETAHGRVLGMLKLAQSSQPGRAVLRRVAGSWPAQPVRAFGLQFPSPLGVAAGFDKNVEVSEGLALLGFGHVEVGTLTPRPQLGNPKPRVFRLLEDRAVINRMGFPNCGVEAALPRLKALSLRTVPLVVGVSLGKQKETPLTDAAADYTMLMRSVYPFADYLAVNVSSPNTPELRALQFGDHLDTLLVALIEESERLGQAHGARRPLLLKISPDLTWDELDSILAAALRRGVSGIIATNTTIERPPLHSPLAGEAGGLSGRPLAERSTEIIRHIASYAGDRLPVIGVGGVFTGEDARVKLDAGAALVQLYTGMVYEGPGIAGRILRGLA